MRWELCLLSTLFWVFFYKLIYQYTWQPGVIPSEAFCLSLSKFHVPSLDSCGNPCLIFIFLSLISNFFHLSSFGLLFGLSPKGKCQAIRFPLEPTSAVLIITPLPFLSMHSLTQKPLYGFSDNLDSFEGLLAFCRSLERQWGKWWQ